MKHSPAAIGHVLDTPLVNNAVHELGERKMHHPLNSMLTCLGPAKCQHIATILPGERCVLLSQCRVDKTLAYGPGLDCVEHLGVPKPLLGGKKMVFPTLLFWLDLICCFPCGHCSNDVIYTAIAVAVAVVVNIIVEG